MAQVTQLTATATPGQVQAFSAKTAVTSVYVADVENQWNVAAGGRSWTVPAGGRDWNVAAGGRAWTVPDT